MRIDSGNILEHLQFAEAKNCALLKEVVTVYVTENPSEINDKVSLNHFPKGFFKDMVVVMARKQMQEEVSHKLSTMSISELRCKAHARGLDVDGTREMLVSSLALKDDKDN